MLKIVVILALMTAILALSACGEEELPPIEQQPDQRHRRARAAGDQQLPLIARELRNQPIGVQVDPHLLAGLQPGAFGRRDVVD